MRSIVKSHAEPAVRIISGVGRVIDNIEALPLSPFDGSIRNATYRVIFSKPGFEKHANEVNSPVRTIVKNGACCFTGGYCRQRIG
jgi:hypothetical protein